MNSDDEAQLLAELENLLKKQIALARRGSLSELEAIAGRCEQVVTQIKETGLLEKPEHKTAKDRLTKLYRELQLLLSTQKEDAVERLKLIHKGKKTLAVYRSSI